MQLQGGRRKAWSFCFHRSINGDIESSDKCRVDFYRCVSYLVSDINRAFLLSLYKLFIYIHTHTSIIFSYSIKQENRGVRMRVPLHWQHCFKVLGSMLRKVLSNLVKTDEKKSLRHFQISS